MATFHDFFFYFFLSPNVYVYMFEQIRATLFELNAAADEFKYFSNGRA